MADNQIITSMYPNAPAVPLDPLGSMSKAAGLGLQLNQNRMFQQAYGSNLAVSNAYKRSLNPDGSLDTGKLVGNVINSRATVNLPETVNSALGARTGTANASTAEAGASNAQQGRALNTRQTVDSVLFPLLTGPNPSYGKAVAALTGFARANPNALSGQDLAYYLGQIPQGPGGEPPTPDQLAAYGANLHIQSLPASEVSQPAPIGVTPDNIAITGTKSQLLQKTSTGGRTVPEPGSSAIPGTTGKPPPGTRFSQDAQGNPIIVSAKTGIPIGPAPGAGPQGAAIGVAPGTAEAQTEVARGSGEQLKDDLKQSATYRRSVFPLEQAIPALESLGKKGTGPGTEQINNIKSFAQSMGVPGIDMNKIEDYDKAKKYLTDYVNQNGNSGTNDKLAASFAGSPSTTISNAAAIDVAKAALALSRMKQAQVLEFQSTGLPAAQYSAWASKWGVAQDPRAFGYDLMSPEAQQKLVSSLGLPSTKEKPNPARDKFTASLVAAHTHELLADPGAPNGQ